MSQPQIKVVNPLNSNYTHLSKSHCDRLKRQGLGGFDKAGRFVHMPRKASAVASSPKHGPRLVVSAFSGFDAFPDRAVFPPSPEVLAKMQHKPGIRSPLRPPLAGPISLHTSTQ